MRLFTRAAPILLLLFGVTLMALAHHPNPDPAHVTPLFPGARIDNPTLHLFQRACQNCHSENTRWPWYSRVPPATWMIARDINNARRRVNFSRWDSYPPDEQEKLLTRIGAAVRTAQMPLPRYMFLHREAVLTGPERQQIYDWTRAERKRLRPTGAKRSQSALGLLSVPETLIHLAPVRHDCEGPL